MIFKKVKPKNLQSPQGNRFQSPSGGNIPDLAQTYTPQASQFGQPSDPRKLSELKAANFLQNSLYNQSPNVNYNQSPFRSKNNSRSNSKRNSIADLGDFDFETSKQTAKRVAIGKSLGRNKQQQKKNFNYTSPQANNRYTKNIDSGLNNSSMLNESQLSRKSAKKTEQALEVPRIEMPGERYSPYKTQKERVKQEVIDKYSGKKKDEQQPYYSHRQFKNDGGLHPTETEKRLYVDDNNNSFNKNRSFLGTNRDEIYDDELEDEVENMKKRKVLQKSPKNDSSSFERNRNRNDTIQEADQSFTSGGDTKRSNFQKGKGRQFQHYLYGNDDNQPNDGNQSFTKKRRNSLSSLASSQTGKSDLSSVKRKQMYNRYKKKILDDQKRKSVNDTVISMPSFQDLYKDLQSLSKLKRPKPQRNLKNIQQQPPIDYDKQWEGRIFQRSPLRPIEASRVHFMEKYNKAKQNVDFKDQEFPPNIRMLTLSKKSKPPNNDFMRAFKQYQKTELSLYKYIDPNTINSGELQNINYLTAIAALSEYPRNITEILENQRINRNGVYYGKICKNGVFRYYTIDDNFALSKQNDQNTPFACSSQLPNLQKEQEIWVQVIEKLLVKAYGTYWDLKKATVKELLRDLTGAPVTEIESNYSIGRTNELTQLLNEYISKKYTVVALQRPGNDQHNTKLLPHFGMTIISANQSQGVRLRNPWGIIEDARGLDYNQETGYLKMSWEAFQEIFEKILIVHTDYDKLYCNRTVSHINGAYCIQTFEKKQEEEEFFIEMTQRDRRQFSNLPNISYEYGESRLMLFKTLDDYKIYNSIDQNLEDNIQYMGGVHAFTEKTLTLQIEQAPPGQYILVAKVDYPTEKHFDFNISYQGSEKVDFERVEYKEHSNFLGQAFMNLVRSQGLRQKETPQKIMEYLYLEPNLRLVFVGFENRNQIQNNQELEMLLRQKKKRNMSIKQQMINRTKTQKETIFFKDFTKLQKDELRLVTIPDFGLDYVDPSYYSHSYDIDTQLKPRHQFNLYPTRGQALIFSVKNPELQMDSRTLKFLGFK